MAVSYIDVHLEIASEWWFRTTYYDKRDYFNYINYPIVNFAFICSNILTAPNIPDIVVPNMVFFC